MTREPDARSAESLVLDHLPDIVTLCNRMFRQVSDAQDATHEAVLAVLRHLPSYRGDGPLRHWVLKVALNAARQHRRTLAQKTLREKTLPDQELPQAVSTNATEEREEQEALRSAIAALPQKLREPLILSYYHGLTQVAIGGLVGCSQKTVHQRIQKGLEHLNRQLATGGALGALAVAPVAGQATLDAVSPALLASVKQSIVGYYAAGGAGALSGAASSASTQLIAGQSLTAAGVATGGIVMKAKILSGVAVIAISCLVGGAFLADQVFASDRDEAHATEIAALRSRLEAAQRDLETERGDLASKKRGGSARVNVSALELETLRAELEQKDEEIASLGAELRRVLGQESGAGGDAASESNRDEQWKEIQDALSGVMDFLQRMQEEGANQYQLGAQMVAALGKVSSEQWNEIMAFDATEADPERIASIRAVMLQAFIFVPDVGPGRDGYMERYLERAQNGGYDQNFTAGALRRLTYKMPPFVDAYARIVAPLNEDLRGRFLEMALDRATRGTTASLRLDGVLFLGSSDDARATTELMRVFGQTANSRRLRLAALSGLASRTDEQTLRVLNDALNTEQDAEVLAQVRKAVERLEKRATK